MYKAAIKSSMQCKMALIVKVCLISCNESTAVTNKMMLSCTELDGFTGRCTRFVY
jgi:hypothetical protein